MYINLPSGLSGTRSKERTPKQKRKKGSMSVNYPVVAYNQSCVHADRAAVETAISEVHNLLPTRGVPTSLTLLL